MSLEADSPLHYHLDVIRDGAAFGELLDRSFPVAQDGRFFDDFPVWDPALTNDPSSVLRLGAYTQRGLAACTAVRMARLKSPGGREAIAIVGAVATDPELRGQGVASNLVAAAVQWALDKGARSVLLWGTDHAALYDRLGFRAAGEQVRPPLASLDLPETCAQADVREGWAPALFELVRSRPGGLALVDHDLKWFSAHKNVRWYWLCDAEGAPVAYAAYGRGIDLGGHVHEWGGEPKALASLLAAVRDRHPEARLLASPGLARRMGFRFEPSEVEPLCLALGDALKAGKFPAWIWGLDSA